MPWYVPIISAVIGGILGFASSLAGGLILSKIDLNKSVITFNHAIKIEISSIVDFLNSIISNSVNELIVDYDCIRRIDKLCIVFIGNASTIGRLEQSKASSIVAFYGKILSLTPARMSDRSEYIQKFDLELCRNSGIALLETL
jgi:hypothetical protein